MLSQIAASASSPIVDETEAAMFVEDNDDNDSNTIDVSVVKREMVTMLARWAIIHGEIGRFLDSVFDREVRLFMFFVLYALLIFKNYFLDDLT
jgi:hypothetical protein